MAYGPDPENLKTLLHPAVLAFIGIVVTSTLLCAWAESCKANPSEVTSPRIENTVSSLPQTANHLEISITSREP